MQQIIQNEFCEKSNEEEQLIDHTVDVESLEEPEINRTTDVPSRSSELDFFNNIPSNLQYIIERRYLMYKYELIINIFIILLILLSPPIGGIVVESYESILSKQWHFVVYVSTGTATVTFGLLLFAIKSLKNLKCVRTTMKEEMDKLSSLTLIFFTITALSFLVIIIIDPMTRLVKYTMTNIWNNPTLLSLTILFGMTVLIIGTYNSILIRKHMTNYEEAMLDEMGEGWMGYVKRIGYWFTLAVISFILCILYYPTKELLIEACYSWFDHPEVIVCISIIYTILASITSKLIAMYWLRKEKSRFIEH